MSAEQKESVQRLVQLLSMPDIKVHELSERAKENNISEEERYYLGLILGHLNKIFGVQTTFQRKKGASASIDALDKKSEDYEKNTNADALKEKLQPYFNSASGKKSPAEKEALLDKINVISVLMGDAYTEANLTFVWQCIQSSEDPQKAKARALLTNYQQHLRKEIEAAYPYEGGIKIKEGNISLINQKKQVIEIKDMPKNLALLTEKHNAITEATNLLNNPESSMTAFKTHMNTKTRPIVEKERTPTDSAFLNALIKLFTNPVGFFFKTAATQGAKVAKEIEQTLDVPNSRMQKN